MKWSKTLITLTSLIILALQGCKPSGTNTGNSTDRKGSDSSTERLGDPKSSGNDGSGGEAAQLEPYGGCDTGDAEDKEWCSRLQIARMGTQPPHVPAGDIPDDPNVSRIYDSPVVFASTQEYIYLSSQTYTLPGYGNQFRDHDMYYLIPTGRFFYKSVSYLGQTTPEGKIVTAWGRYHLTSNDEIEAEVDTGEKLSMRLKAGRRNLVWGQYTYGQVDWENEALRREMAK